MKNFILLFIVAALVATLFAGPSHALDGDRLKVILSRLEQRAEKIETLRCRFEQTTYSAMFEEEQEGKGEMLFQRPERLRWELLHPFRRGFAVDGAAAVRWRGEKGASQTFRLAEAPGLQALSEQLLAWLRGDYAWLAAHYAIELENEQPIRLKLTPAGDDGPVRNLTIVFTSDETHLERLELRQWDGDEMRLAFSAVEINGPMEAALFQQR